MHSKNNCKIKVRWSVWPQHRALVQGQVGGRQPHHRQGGKTLWFAQPRVGRAPHLWYHREDFPSYEALFQRRAEKICSIGWGKVGMFGSQTVWCRTTPLPGHRWKPTLSQTTTYTGCSAFSGSCCSQGVLKATQKCEKMFAIIYIAFKLKSTSSLTSPVARTLLPQPLRLYPS